VPAIRTGRDSLASLRRTMSDLSQTAMGVDLASEARRQLDRIVPIARRRIVVRNSRQSTALRRTRQGEFMSKTSR
jgi:hypothetical protein